MARPLSPDKYSRFSPLSPYHNNVPWGSIKPRARHSWLQSPDDLRFDSHYPPLAPRSTSTSAVPMILHRQLRAGLRNASSQHVSSNSRGTSNYKPGPSYFEDTTDYVTHKPYQRQGTSAAGYITISSSPLVQQEFKPLTGTVELANAPILSSLSDMITSVVKEPYPVDSDKHLPTVGPNQKISSMTIVRKPVQSMSSINIPPTRTLCPAKVEHISVEDRDVLQASDGCNTPRSPSSSPWNKSPPNSPSPVGEAPLKRCSKGGSIRKAIVSEPTTNISNDLELVRETQHSMSKSKDRLDAPFASLLDPLPYLVDLLRCLYDAITPENIDMAKRIGGLIIRVLYMLYVAAFVVEYGSRGAFCYTEGFDPIIKFLGFLLWMATRS
jgi:hypothetical protein